MPDLHTHTSHSDGLMSPRQLVEEAKAAGINLLSVTDHDTVKGLADAKLAAKDAGIGLIPGIEISTAGDEEVHILAYFVKPEMAALKDLVRRVSIDRQSRRSRFLEKLRNLGVALTDEDLQIPDGTDCTRSHIGRALVRKGVVPSVSKAFEIFLAVGRPAYVSRIRLDTEDTLRMLREEGAVPVLAHPELIRNMAAKSPERIAKLKDAGLYGIEAYHSRHSESVSRYWDALAREHGLLVTGGSDFHKHGDDHGPIGCCIHHWTRADEDAARLMELMPDAMETLDS